MSRLIRRVFLVLTLFASGARVHAAPGAGLGTAEDFVARVQRGEVSLATFDFAKAGYWNLSDADRNVWLGAVQVSVFGNQLTSDTCDRAERRRFENAMWLMVLMQSADAPTWSKAAGALRSRLRQVDRELEAAAATAKTTATNPRARQLQRRVARDQAIRDPEFDAKWSANLPPLAAKNWMAMKLVRMMAIDCDDTEWLEAQLAQIGWFDIPTFGAEADNNAWLLVQHADRNKTFQRRTLDYLQGLPPGKTNPKNLAYLADRVAMGEGRPQRYGTQGQCQPDGTWKSNESEDPAHLDERRSSLGLDPIAVHAINIAKENCPQPAR